MLGDQVTLFAPKLHQSNFVVKLNRSLIVEFSSTQRSCMKGREIKLMFKKIVTCLIFFEIATKKLEEFLPKNIKKWSNQRNNGTYFAN